MSIHREQSSAVTYTTGARVMHMGKACNDRSVEGKTGLVLTARIGDCLGHA